MTSLEHSANSCHEAPDTLSETAESDRPQTNPIPHTWLESWMDLVCLASWAMLLAIGLDLA
eukprot:1143470-Pelagomonas_calceolata.AAC.1